MFDPRTWRPQTPTTAYMELRDDDAFWAARRVAAFTDELIRAAVHTGEFSDPTAEKYLADVLIKRRDKITSIYLNAVNPIVSPRLDANGRLTFENAAVAAGVASGAGHLPRVLVSLRQRDRRDSSRFGNAEPDDDDRGSGRPADRRRAVSSRWTSPWTAQAHPSWRRPIRTLFPPRGRRLDARGTRTVAREPPGRSSRAKFDALIERAHASEVPRSARRSRLTEIQAELVALLAAAFGHVPPAIPAHRRQRSVDRDRMRQSLKIVQAIMRRHGRRR